MSSSLMAEETHLAGSTDGDVTEKDWHALMWQAPSSCPEEAGCPGVRSWHLCWGHVGLIGLDELDCRRSWKFSCHFAIRLQCCIWHVWVSQRSHNQEPRTSQVKGKVGMAPSKGPSIVSGGLEHFLAHWSPFSLGLTLFSFRMCPCRNSFENSLTRVARKLTLWLHFNRTTYQDLIFLRKVMFPGMTGWNPTHL